MARLQGSLTAGGDASLQNAMNLATESLKSIPPYGHREALCLTPLSLRCARAAPCSLHQLHASMHGRVISCRGGSACLNPSEMLQPSARACTGH